MDSQKDMEKNREEDEFSEDEELVLGGIEEAGADSEEPASTPEEIAFMQQRLLDFLQVFIKAMLATGYYSQDHPQAQKAREGIYESFEELIGDHPEVSFMARFEHGVAKDIYIDGVMRKTTSLNEVMTSAQSEIFLPKFAEYFTRRGLVSFSLKKDLTSNEFERFVDVMCESKKEADGDEDVKGKDLTRMLVEKKIINVRSEERRVGKEGRSRWSPYH